MLSNDAALEHGSASRLLHPVVAGLGGLLAAALFLGVFDGGLPRPVRAGASRRCGSCRTEARRPFWRRWLG